MPAPRIRTRLSQAAANRLLAYDKRTGALTWRVDRGPNCKAGQPAGTVHPVTKRRSVMIDGRYWSANRLVWFMVMGQMPKGRLLYSDNDPTNLRWNNIIPEADFLSRNPTNIYQRNYRRRVREMLADGRILGSLKGY